jgi:hypothetical protein
MDLWPSPTKDTSIENILLEVIYNNIYKIIYRNKMSINYLRNIIETEYSKFYENYITPSLEVWYKKDSKILLNNVIDHVVKFQNKKRRLRGIIRSIVILNKIYFESLCKYYHPEGYFAKILYKKYEQKIKY